MNTRENIIKIIPLGGLNEIGKNMTVYEYQDEIIVIDAGLKFPEDDMFGIDIVIPDINYLIENQSKIKAIVLTHAHEDHIGALPYVLQDIDAVMYGTEFTMAMVSKKLENAEITGAKIKIIDPDETLKIGKFSLDFIRVTHSIPDAVSVCISTELGTIIHTGDFKIDLTPVDNKPIDLNKFAKFGSKGVLALLADSTNANREGYTLSESKVGETLESIFFNSPNSRIVVASFSSNVHRVQQIVNAAHLFGRKVALSGRSMQNTISVAENLDYISVPEEMKINIRDVNSYPDNEVCIITTGSQGERFAGLSRMANKSHHQIEISEGDIVILSSSPIPGNEKSVGEIINKLYALGADVIYDELADVHASGHACIEELKLIHSLIKPEYFVPVHGEYTHIIKHAELAKNMGVSRDNIFLLENGDILTISETEAKKFGKVKAGSVLIDGQRTPNQMHNVVAERRDLSNEGVVFLTILFFDEDQKDYKIKVLSRGFMTSDECIQIYPKITSICEKIINDTDRSKKHEEKKMRYRLNNQVSKFINDETGKKPILVMNIFKDI